MKQWIKAAGLGLAILASSGYASAAQAAQKVGYVAVNQTMAQLIKKSNISEKLRTEFKDRIAEVRKLEEKGKSKLEKFKRDGELMSQSERTKLEREIEAIKADIQLKAKALQEDQKRRGAEEQQKLVMKLRQAIEKVAKKEGYDVVIDAQAVLFAKPEDDLSAKVVSAIK